MTASFNTSFFSTPATAASGVSKKGFRSTAYNNYVVDVIDFDNEIHTSFLNLQSNGGLLSCPSPLAEWSWKWLE